MRQTNANRNANAMVAEAIQRKELVRPNHCSKCKRPAFTVGHHEDYSRPLDVVWLCLSCHRQLHEDKKRLFSLYAPTHAHKPVLMSGKVQVHVAFDHHGEIMTMWCPVSDLPALAGAMSFWRI